MYTETRTQLISYPVVVFKFSVLISTHLLTFRKTISSPNANWPPECEPQSPPCLAAFCPSSQPFRRPLSPNIATAARTLTSNKFPRFDFYPVARGYGEFASPLSASTATLMKYSLNSIINRSDAAALRAVLRHLSKCLAIRLPHPLCHRGQNAEWVGVGPIISRSHKGS